MRHIVMRMRMLPVRSDEEEGLVSSQQLPAASHQQNLTLHREEEQCRHSCICCRLWKGWLPGMLGFPGLYAF